MVVFEAEMLSVEEKITKQEDPKILSFLLILKIVFRQKNGKSDNGKGHPQGMPLLDSENSDSDKNPLISESDKSQFRQNHCRLL